MYSISDIAHKLGVARSTLLYYERIGLILPTRNPANGYRQYSEYDLNQLILLRQLQKAGLTLQECQGIMQGKLDEDVIEQRLLGLEQELKEMQMARDVLYALYGKATGHPIDSRDFRKRLQDWHSQFEKRSSDAHLHWLRQLGFSEKDAIHVRCVSRDILDSVHPETPDGHDVVFMCETSNFSQGQENQTVARRRSCLRRTSKRAD